MRDENGQEASSPLQDDLRRVVAEINAQTVKMRDILRMQPECSEEERTKLADLLEEWNALRGDERWLR